MDGLGLFGIGKYPVFRRYVLRPVVMLFKAHRVRRYIAAGSEYAALVDTHMLSLGDTLALNLQYEEAEEQYLAAKALAGKIYFDQGRTDAMAALEKLYADQKANLEQKEEDAQKATEDQAAAAGVLSEGDAAFAKGDYEGAQAFYTTALQKYTELEDQAQIDALSVKLDACAKKLAQQEELETEAEAYMRQGENAYNEKNYVQAKKYYLLAKDVYASMENDAKVAEVTRRLELVEMGISEEEKAAQEAEEKAAQESENTTIPNETTPPAAVG